MRKILWLYILIMPFAVARAGNGDMRVAEASRQQVYYASVDSDFVCGVLAEIRKQPSAVNVPLFFARKFINRPYVAHTLEVFDDERLIVNTKELDCTTLVENVTALTLCVYRQRYTFRDYLDFLCGLRYRDGKLDGYTSRLHYFTDWIEDNVKMQTVAEIQQPVPPFNAIQKLSINYMSTHWKSYKALAAHQDFIPEIRRQEKNLTGKTYRYIPKSDVRNTKLMRETVKDGDIIAITCNKPGLDIAHLGVAVWKSDGLHLLNASMIHKKVVEEPMTLYQYLRQHKSHTGIRIIRINRQQ